MDIIPSPARLWRDKTDFFKPFRKAAKTTAAGENIRPLFDPDLANGHVENDSELKDLNDALRTLVEIFPNVEPEMFREMLTSMGKESRVAVVTEHVLKRNVKSTRERSRRSMTREDTARKVTRESRLPIADTFRGDRYHEAVKILLYQEFRSLSHSTIKGVMAENNGSYTKSRPTLQILASKTWRSSIASFWTRKTASEDASNHPALMWQTIHGSLQPFVNSSESAQLDREVYNLLVRPILDKRRREMLSIDQAVALDLNEAEAIEARSTYDCECCYSTVAFEQIATCGSGEHFLCFDCIRRTTNEALYGQGWARSVDLEKSSIRCFAPALQECQASLPTELVERALHQDHEHLDVWPDFCRRVTGEVLLKSRIAFQRCPFCTYAEVDETPTALLRDRKQIRDYFTMRLSRTLSAGAVPFLAGLTTFVVLVLLFCSTLLVMVLSFLIGLALLFTSPRPTLSLGPITLAGPLVSVVSTSLKRLYKRRRGLKFRCEEPGCSKTSCTRCLTEWHDIHTCFDSEKTSLRTTIEASATAAVKRTCPRCFLSFVKASGCNKLVCNCGYTMCYVCRSEITAKEGYSHFCQHFRPSGGRCNECDRCDLYGDEDEESTIRRAAEIAEREWREREAQKNKTEADNGDALAARAMIEAVVGHGKQAPWSESLLDAVLDVLVTFKDE